MRLRHVVPATRCVGLAFLWLPVLLDMPQQQPDPHAGHAAHGAPSQPKPSPLPKEPAAVLQPDPLDAPAETSKEDAARAAAAAAEMAGGAHHMSHGSYRHVDAGRVPATSPARRGEPAAHRHPPVSPSSAASPAHSHHHHAAPSPSPSPTPRPSPPPKEDRP